MRHDTSHFGLGPLYLMRLIGEIQIDFPEDETSIALPQYQIC